MASCRGGSRLGLWEDCRPVTHSAWVAQRALGFKLKAIDPTGGVWCTGRWNGFFFLMWEMTWCPLQLGPRTLLSPSTPPPSLGTLTHHLHTGSSIYFPSLILSKSNTRASECLPNISYYRSRKHLELIRAKTKFVTFQTWFSPTLPIWVNNPPYHPVAQGRNNGGTLDPFLSLTCPFLTGVKWNKYKSSTFPPVLRINPSLSQKWSKNV